jgi:sigma-E factor negative regulatory protein RseC
MTTATAGFTRTAAPGAPVGIVIATDGKRAEVSTARHGACAGCSEVGSCDLGAHAANVEVVTVENRVGARPGDTVELDLAGSATVILSLLVWGAPLAGLLLGAVAGAATLKGQGTVADVGALVGALVGAALATLLVRRVDRRVGRSSRLTPYITRIVGRGSRPAGREGSRP